MLSLIPLPWKIGIGCGVLLAIFLGFRNWLARHDEAVFQEGKQAGITEIENKKKAEWAAKEVDLKAAGIALEQNKAKTNAELVQSAKEVQASRASLAKALAAAAAGKEVASATVCAIPDASLDSALRAISAELAAANP